MKDVSLYRSGPQSTNYLRILVVCSPRRFIFQAARCRLRLSQIERNLVLTGVYYTGADLLDQMQTALKKFIGRSALGQKE